MGTLDNHEAAVKHLSEDIHDLIKISNVNVTVGMAALLVALKASCDAAPKATRTIVREVFAELLISRDSTDGGQE